MKPHSADSALPGERHGDAPPTFDVVYHAHVQTVARWAARLGGPGADVEDITQEVFLVVNRRLCEFRQDSRVSSWLFSITANVAANHRRRRRIRRFWVRLVPNVGTNTPALADTPVEQIERRERRAQFYQALDALREKQRQALILFELEGMTVADIAKLMGMRVGNVRVLLHRARAAFLKRMTERELDTAREPRKPREPERQR